MNSIQDFIWSCLHNNNHLNRILSPLKYFGLDIKCNLIWLIVHTKYVSIHTSLEVLVGQKKELWIPPIWGCWGPTGDSFFTHEQIKHPPFFEGRWYTGKIICQIWAEWAVCLDSYLWKGWMFYLLIGKKLTSSRSTTTPDRWYQKFFFFLPTGTSNDVWYLPTSFSIISVKNIRFLGSTKPDSLVSKLMMFEKWTLHCIVVLFLKLAWGTFKVRDFNNSSSAQCAKMRKKVHFGSTML